MLYFLQETWVNYHLRMSKEDKEFISLELQGDVELVQSMETGRFYATAKKCFVTSTFNEQSAKALIGTNMPGSIVRVECESYDFTVPETGEVISLAHSYTYSPEGDKVVAKQNVYAEA
jgi:hypothetical protein